MDEFTPDAKKPAQPASGASGVARGRRSITSVSDVLSKLVNKLGLEKRLKENALLGLWPTVVGDQIAQRSRTLFIDFDGNIAVAVKDASVAQELVLQKMVILEKLRVFARALGVEVKGIKFNLKQYYSQQDTAPPLVVRTQRPRASEQELAAFTIESAELQELSDLRVRLERDGGASAEGISKIVRIYERELRLKKWRQISGLPSCHDCGEPSESLHGPTAICRDCYFALKSHARDIPDIEF
jgi:predicted nucleic acid-binding Zn ribbon protein